MGSVWLRRAAFEIASDVFKPACVEVDVAAVDISFGYPIKMQRVSYRGGKETLVGGATIGFVAIVIPPQSDPIYVLGVLVHELIHIARPGDGHKREFQRISDLVGLLPPYTATTPGSGLIAKLKEIVLRIGPMPTPFDCRPKSRRAFIEISDGVFAEIERPKDWAPPRRGG